MKLVKETAVIESAPVLKIIIQTTEHNILNVITTMKVQTPIKFQSSGPWLDIPLEV